MPTALPLTRRRLPVDSLFLSAARVKQEDGGEQLTTNFFLIGGNRSMDFAE